VSDGRDDASDATSLGEVLAAYEGAGYTAQMAAREDARVMCFACRTESAAAEMGVDALCRVEGASDPADMLAVFALRCPRCDARGTLVLNYGPEAAPSDAEVMRTLDVGSLPTTPTGERA
jgi:hypothetical protein